MRRRDVLKSAVAGTVALAAPRVGRAQANRLLKFTPHADLASLDPVWTTADISRNYSLAVLDTLFGIDAKFQVQHQMLAGHTVSADGKQWDLTLRDGLKFHDGTPVLARDCVATLKRVGKREPLNQALAARIDEMTAPNDKTISIRLKKPFALLPDALAQYQTGIMPERLASTDAFTEVKESVGSGPFRFVTGERVPGSLVVYERFKDYVPRADGAPSFTAGPKIANLDRVEWQFIPDPQTVASALTNKEIDWWENPALDLVPSLRKKSDLTIRVTDITGEIGCIRFNQLQPPFDNPAIRRVVMKAVDQREYMEAIAGAEPSLIKTDVGIFVPGTTLASTVGVEVTRGPKDFAKLKQELAAAGYKGEKIVLLGATTIPTIHAASEVVADMLQKIGFNVDYQALDWVTVVTRRASKEPIDKGGWNIFITYLGGTGNVTPATDIAIRGNGAAAWFGWPTIPKMEELRDAWFEAPDVATQKKLCEEMQKVYFEAVPYVALGMYDGPTAYHTYLTDIRDGYPQFYGLKKG